ncbi:MAG: LPS export ABC transporter periplasmic protein LptC [Sedimenticola sp.]|nr:LPS export ABC transporter periplasmic protein LptC [Sedimenticola sp.]MCW8946999.1 LPS export ABC transporter periplasmic protein LptC [Sedimenticola sp.]MCW8950401.1 LPS export ABC transporter periplasmic protein LptC [Sedimenticola sp.]MCW9021874.1 LPS export ABC transporter periplasmic protein LptC [Sedimenticola sp.]
MIEQKNRVIGGLLLLLVGGSLWLSQSSRDDDSNFTSLEHRPDYYLEAVDTTLMGIDGKPSKRLIAERMTHFIDDDSTELKLPRLTLYDQERPPWRVKSETGWLSGDGEVLLLQGAVKIDRSAAPGIRPFHITTRDLRVQQRDHYVETDAEVHARSNKDRIDAKGMQIWLQQPMRIKLLANVRGRYEVNP